MPVLPPQSHRGHQVGHMVVCGDDGLAQRLATELRDVYREQVVLVVPGDRAEGRLEEQPAAQWRAAGLIGRFSSTARGSAGAAPDDTSGGVLLPIREVMSGSPTEAALLRAGVDRAAALALLYEDDETNLRSALLARRLNPGLRLVVRMYNRKLGQHMEELLDQAALVAMPGMDRAVLEASTTVLSDADTAAPALAATAVAGTSKVVQADGLLLRAVERTPPGRGEVPDPGLCTLALLSSTTADPAGAEGSDASGTVGPLLLPDDRTVHTATGRGTVILETVRHAAPARPLRRLSLRGAAFGDLFSGRLRWALAGIVASVFALTVTTILLTDADPVHAAYLTLLDLFSINDPAVGESTARQVLQLLSGLVGLALLPSLSPAPSKPLAPSAPPTLCVDPRAACPGMSCCSVSERSAPASSFDCASSRSRLCVSRRTPTPAASRSPAASACPSFLATSLKKASWKQPRSTAHTPCSHLPARTPRTWRPPSPHALSRPTCA